MKKLVFLSIGMLAFALQPAVNAQTTLFTTYEDWQGWQAQGAQWGNPAPIADNTSSLDVNNVNGLANPSAPGAAGTQGALQVGPANGWTCIAYSTGINGAALVAVDPGNLGDGVAQAAAGNFYIDYSLPDNEGGSYFQPGVLMQYPGNGYFGTFFSSSSTDLGYTDKNGLEVFQATIPYTIAAGGAGSLGGMGFGIMVNTDYASLLPSYIDSISVSAVSTAAPEPGTIALIGVGLTGLLVLRRRLS